MQHFELPDNRQDFNSALSQEYTEILLLRKEFYEVGIAEKIRLNVLAVFRSEIEELLKALADVSFE